MTKKRKILKTSSEVIPSDAVTDDEYKCGEESSNVLIAPPKKKKKVGEEKKKEQKEINAKKAEAKKRRQLESEAKISKKKKKKLAKILERKSKKDSRESLIASLQQYSLSMDSLKNLASTAHMQDKMRKTTRESDPTFPEKLKSLSGRDTVPVTIHNKPLVQEHYYETDSESEGEEEQKEDIRLTDNVASTSGLAGSEVICKEDAEVEEKEDQVDCCSGNNNEGVKKGSVAEKYIKRVTKDLNDGKNQRMLVRSDEVQAQRSKLPIFGEEQVVVEAVNENTFVVICGETGSGKTTQLPQFLFEAGYTEGGHLIGITEPRRVAAMSMASRVGYEMGLPNVVSYQIRYEGNRSPDTRILFMTDGVLMKEIQNDIMLSSYSVIIIDEAHERSVYSDVLIGLLSRIAPLRARTGCPLKLVIMSATLHLTDFTQKLLFPTSPPRVLHIDARQFPVAIHFERRTPVNYLHAAFRKVCRIHETLPPGTILVFLSGRREVETVQKWLTARYPARFDKKQNGTRHTRKSRFRKKREVYKDVKLEDYKVNEEDERNADVDELGMTDEALDDWLNDDIEEFADDGTLHEPRSDVQPLLCLPLYSLLSSEKQKRVFEPARDNCRVCVISTNVAETSLTIPAVRYVVDSGKEKRRVHDPVTGVSQFIVHWISQASADQRAGRAGRVQAGHVYRLYSSAVFADFEKFSTPEILNKPVDQLVLHMKSMNIVKVANFPFPTRPDIDALEEAEKRLVRLGALQVCVKNNVKEARISPLGKLLSIFPLAPKYAKILVMAKQNDLLPYACCLVAVLSVREPLVPICSLRGKTNEETQQKMLEMLKQRRNWCRQGQTCRFGDLTVLLQAILAAQAEDGTEEACVRYGVRCKALTEIRKLRRQLINLINSSCELDKPLALDLSLPPPNESQCRLLRQIVIASLCENIARRIDRSQTTDEVPKGAYECQRLKDHVFIDPSSVLYKEEPDWILYQEIVEVNGKKCMQNVMVVECEWLPKLAYTYCHFSAVKNAEPRYDWERDCVVSATTCTFGDRQWSLGTVDEPVIANINLYRHFAKFFLDGSVCPPLAVYADKLLASPSTMVKSWAKLQQRTEKLLNALIEYEVTSRARLLEVWKERSEYLLEEYLEWLPQCFHDGIQLSWPPSGGKSPSEPVTA